MKPTVLIAATSPWFPTARLSISLANAGFIVEAISPSGHPLRRTKAVRRNHNYHGLAPLASLTHAIAAANPDVIVPGDDLSTHHLHNLYEQERQRGQKGIRTCELIERSFGSSESFAIVYERASFMRVAQDLGVLAPRTAAIANLSDLRRWTSDMGFPVVLKADGTSGGEGVRIAQTPEEAESAFRRLQAPPLLARAAKRAFVNQDKTLVWPSLLRRRYVLSAQTFVNGREATSTVACWKGTVLAGLHFEVIQKRYAAGPATVMRLTENAEMSSAVQKVVRRLNLSGLHGFDFMIEAETGRPHLIEINPRTTQVGHLTLGPGRDLSAALHSAVSGECIRPTATLTEKGTIALFPQEWMRDPNSSYLKSAYHDVPWEEPGLLRACILSGHKKTASQPSKTTELAASPSRVPGLETANERAACGTPITRQNQV